VDKQSLNDTKEFLDAYTGLMYQFDQLGQNRNFCSDGVFAEHENDKQF
jgi:hypothetical protein